MSSQRRVVGDPLADLRRQERIDVQAGKRQLQIPVSYTHLITLLTDNRRYWYFGLVLATVGIVAAARGFMVH